MSLTKWAVCGSFALSTVAQAQQQPHIVTTEPLPLTMAEQAPAPDKSLVSRLPFGTPVIVSLDSELSTESNLRGDSFSVTVAYDVLLDGVIAIPKGTKGRGEITFLTKKGAFGKPGIIGIALRDMQLNGQKIILDGRFREEAGNNNAAAAATMFAVGIFAGLVKGKTSSIPAGRELKGRTGEEFSVTHPVLSTLATEIRAAETIVVSEPNEAAPIHNPQ